MLFISLLAFVQLSISQAPESKMSREEYINKYSEWAVKEMKESGVPASITLAQGMLESDNGNSRLAREANNHFGIKCHNSWDGKTFHQDDDAKNECFRKYKSAYESYKDHSAFLRKYSRYDFLFELKITDYKGWCKGLKKAGYATNPKYPQLLIKIIEDNELFKYDKMTVKDIKMDNKNNNDNQIADNDTKKDNKKNNKKHQLADDDNFTVNAFGREVHLNNRIKYVIVKEGDSFKSLAKELEMMDWQLIKYNDLPKSVILKKGQMLYIQPKRGKADFKYDYHTVEKDETMYSISQKYGIKLSKLYRKNLMKEGDKLKVGQKLYLRKNKPTA